MGVHATSNLTYYVGEQCSAFTSEIGREGDFAGTVIFTVIADGEVPYQSRSLVNGFAPEKWTSRWRAPRTLN